MNVLSKAWSFLEYCCLEIWIVLCCASLDFISHYGSEFILFSEKVVLYIMRCKNFGFLSFFDRIDASEALSRYD